MRVIFTSPRKAVKQTPPSSVVGGYSGNDLPMSLLQIDTINIVARSPYLVLSVVWEIILPSGWMSLWRVANNGILGA